MIYLFNDRIYYISFDFSFSAGLAYILNRIEPDGTGKQIITKTDLSLLPTGEPTLEPTEDPNANLLYDAGNSFTYFTSSGSASFCGDTENKFNLDDVMNWQNGVAVAAGYNHSFIYSQV
ncbi:MAG TPA: hypothetical protein DCM45_02520 [Clostridiales bacterium]|nr:hypothetical protein [Clostridiales bacterium]